MKRGNNNLFLFLSIIAVLVVGAIGYYYEVYSRNSILLSPAPRMKFSDIKNIIDIQDYISSRISWKGNDLQKIYFSPGGEPSGGEPLCPAPGCQTFSAGPIRVKGNPALNIDRIPPEAQGQIDELIKETSDFIERSDCGDCKKVPQVIVNAFFTPVNSQGGICSGGGLVTISAKGGNALGSCFLAAFDAFSKAKKQYKEIIKDVCHGEGCTPIITRSDVFLPPKCYKDRQRFFPLWVSVDLIIYIQVSCEGKSITNEYDLFADVTACVSCSPNPKKGDLGKSSGVFN